MPGTTPEKRRKRLRNLSKNSNVKKPSAAASKSLHSSYVKVNITNDPPSLDLYEINHKAGLDEYMFQGDINFDERQLDQITSSLSAGNRKKRQVSKVAPLWPEKIVYYYFDSVNPVGSEIKETVRIAIQFLESKTCIKFVEDQNAFNRIRIINGVGCYSNVGMTGGDQALSLGSGCNLDGIVAHELSHALGVFHAQMRSDRDDYVTVDVTDVPLDLRQNFIKFTEAESLNYTEYEYGSYMQYSSRAFVTSGGVDSIVPNDPIYVYTMGGRIVTFSDIKVLNTHYSCSCEGSTLACENGGYPNPADCSVCNCPYGFSGQLCTERPDYQCGSTLAATDKWQSESFTFGDESNIKSARTTFDYCVYWITAPVGKQIQFRIDEATNTQCGYGCTFNGIEPRLKLDQTMTQPRYCCDEFNGEIHNAETNPMPVIAYNRYYLTSYKFSYKYVDMEKPSCKDLSDKETCLKLNNEQCSLYNQSQLKVMCAETLGLCGKMVMDVCEDRFTDKECLDYKLSGRCASDAPLIAEYNCAKTCGFCETPV
ncbi:unnamed protein product [Caenorhabditis bovis]|uniref:Zinc metalloproteinase n=1 Tax=Caenorhabditis bovis TaxID=2654633 RepID=A0A8S1E952_9PELO|nr:unnamed protein product [Caenorhabditis bovis]